MNDLSWMGKSLDESMHDVLKTEPQFTLHDLAIEFLEDSKDKRIRERFW